MKQNAVGLANICILSTAVLVVLSSTVSLYMGMDNVMRTRYPSDVITSYAYMPEEDAKYNMSYNYDTELIEKTIQNHANKYNVEIQDVNKYYSFSLVGIVDGESFRPITDDISQGMKDMVIFRAMTLDDYKAAAAEGENIKELPGDSLYLLSSDSRYSSMDNFTVGENVFKIDSASQTMELDNKFAEQTFAYDYIFIIVPDFENLIMVKDEVNNMYREREAQDYGATSVTYNYKFNLSGDLDDKKEFNITLRDALNDADIPHVSTVENIFTTRQQFMELYGSLFFIGIFIGTLFLMATVLIIYYKQVSEGYEDRNRFLIMRNVGMSKKEVRTVIKNQILTIFYLPILLAVVHVAFAFDITRKILAILNLTNVKLFVECTLGTIFIFVIIYGIVYKLTAKSYYKIVNSTN
jgi:putative ABC transport system permease protein